MSEPPGKNQSCPSCWTGNRWLLPVLLALFLGAFMYASRARPPGPTAFEWNKDLDAALAQAGETGRHVLVDFYATWCGPCRMMDADVFPRDDVAEALGDWIMVKIDVDKNRDLAERFHVNGYPTFFVLDPQGEIVAALPGALPADQFIEWIQSVRESTSAQVQNG